MRSLVLTAITAYQRHLSPRKGYCCAYRMHTGRCGCSALGYRAIRWYGVWKGLAVLRQRMVLCGVAHRRFADAVRRPPAAQRGDCDLGACACDDAPCKASNCNLPGCGHVTACCDAGGCDWSGTKKAPQEQDIYIPPATSKRACLHGYHA